MKDYYMKYVNGLVWYKKGVNYVWTENLKESMSRKRECIGKLTLRIKKVRGKRGEVLDKVRTDWITLVDLPKTEEGNSEVLSNNEVDNK